MFTDQVALLYTDPVKEQVKLIAAKRFNPVAMDAQQQMLMPGWGGSVRMATRSLMYPLGEAEVFEGFQRTVDRH